MADASTGDLEQIRRTLALYCQLCDDGRFDEWAELYTADATFSVMGRTYTGPREIKGFIEKGQPPEQRGKHVCANSIIDIDPTGTSASARTDYVFVGRTDEGLAITSAGRYHDTLVREAERWLFQSRRIVFLGDE
jgi:3-phenylpropionate/cinnamic acid dioxygenase small subunit